MHACDQLAMIDRRQRQLLHAPWRQQRIFWILVLQRLHPRFNVMATVDVGISARLIDLYTYDLCMTDS